jgi:4-amino-4-deoxy-L-arabinose transferase-like glycosyltransferase
MRAEQPSKSQLASRQIGAVEKLGRWLSLVAGLALAFFSHQNVGAQLTLLQASLLFAAAALLFLYGAPAPMPDRQQTAPLTSVMRSGRAAIVYTGMLLSLLLAGLAAWILWDQISSLPGLLLWILSMLILCASVWQLNATDQPSRLYTRQQARDRSAARLAIPLAVEVGLFALILFATLGIRLWQLDFFPNGLQSDEANNAMDALKWLRGAPYTPYSEINEGQASLFTYLIALSFRFLGADLFSLRLAPVLAGAVTVAAFYWMARNLFTPLAALAGTALLAAARWHITFSRIVYELILAPLAAIWLFFSLHRGLRDSRPRDFVLAGLAMALGFNTYTGFRTIPLGVALLFLYWMVTHYRRIGSILLGGLLFTVSFVIGMIPLLIYTLQNPNVVMIRTRQLNIFGEIEAAGSLEPLWKNLRNYLMMFNLDGDPVAINNLPGEPMLSALVGALFLLGIVYALRYRHHPKLFLSLAWIVSVLPAGIFSVTLESPSSRRVIGMLPVIFLLVTAVFDAFWRSSAQTWHGWRKYFWAATVGVFVLVVAQVEVNTFFQRQITHPSVRLAFSPVDSSIGKYLAGLDQPVALFLDQNYRGHSAIRFIAREPQYTVLDPALHLPLPEPQAHDLLYILSPGNEALRFLFELYYPAGEWTPHLDPYGGVMFYTFAVTREDQLRTHGLIARIYPDLQWDAAAAVEERVPGLVLPQVNLEADRPVGVMWSGSLRIPVHGLYQLNINSVGPVTLQLDGELLLESEGGIQTVERELVSGFHNIALRAVLAEGQQPPTLMWSGPLPAAGVPASAFYTSASPPIGLVGTYYTNPHWQGIPHLIQHDLVLASTDALHSPYSIIWQGALWIDQPGLYRFGATSDDGSWLYINGDLVVDNGGHHGARYVEGPALELDAGYHNIEIRYFQDGGSHKFELYWIPPGRGRELVPPEQLAPRHLLPPLENGGTE